MRASHDLSGVWVSFTEKNLVPNAGLLPTAAVAQRIGLAEVIDKRLRLAEHGANSGAKDLDSSIVPVYGCGKQGAAFGYTKVRGYHPQFATCASTGMVLFSRLRGGSAGVARGAKSFLTETVSRVRDAGATGQPTVRADSAFYNRAMLATAVKLDVLFSVTARQDTKIRAAIEAIDQAA